MAECPGACSQRPQAYPGALHLLPAARLHDAPNTCILFSGLVPVEDIGCLLRQKPLSGVNFNHAQNSMIHSPCKMSMLSIPHLNWLKTNQGNEGHDAWILSEFHEFLVERRGPGKDWQALHLP